MMKALKRQSGFSLIEVVVGMVFSMMAAVALVPAFTQNLIVGDTLWERRLVVRVLEGELDRACDEADVSGFDSLEGTAALTTNIPAELSGGTWARDVTCLDGGLVDQGILVGGACPNGEQLKRVRVTVQWTSRGRNRAETSADYLIAQTGVCG